MQTFDLDVWLGTECVSAGGYITDFNSDKAGLVEGSFFWRGGGAQSDVISFFVTRKCKKKKMMKIDENSFYCKRNSSCVLNKLRNFNEIFRKDVTYDNMKFSGKMWLNDNIKSHKKPGDHPLFRRYIFRKTTV